MRPAFVVLVLALLGGTAAAGKRADVTMPDTATVEGKALVLNGMGIRKATIFRVKVYVAGLYLETRSRNADEILRSEQVKRLDLVLVRDVERDEILEAWKDGFKKNGADMAKLKTRFDAFAGWMTDLKEHGTLSFLYVPGRGITVTLNGKARGTIAGADFATAFFAIWLGREPADDGLKDGLLGK